MNICINLNIDIFQGLTIVSNVMVIFIDIIIKIISLAWRKCIT